MLQSQHDPAIDRLTLGQTMLTIHGFGCYLVSIANLYQKPVTELLKVPGGLTSEGLVVSDVLAQYCGGKYLGSTNSTPPGLCIACTDHYAALGYPTHFFCVNMDTKQMIDPLDFPAVLKPLTYNITQYRVFSNTKLAQAIVGTYNPPPAWLDPLTPARQLQIAEEAVGRVGGLRQFVLQRLIVRLKAMLGF